VPTPKHGGSCCLEWPRAPDMCLAISGQILSVAVGGPLMRHRAGDLWRTGEGGCLAYAHEGRIATTYRSRLLCNQRAR
jgi:hypothetical protein